MSAAPADDIDSFDLGLGLGVDVERNYEFDFHTGKFLRSTFLRRSTAPHILVTHPNEFGPALSLENPPQVTSILDELDGLGGLNEHGGLGLDPPAFGLASGLASPVCRSAPVVESWRIDGEVTPSPLGQDTSDAYFPTMSTYDREHLTIPDDSVPHPSSPIHPKPEPFEATELSVLAHSRVVEPVPTSDLRCRVKACLRQGGESLVQQVIQEVRSSAPPFVVPESCRIYMDRPEKWVLVGRGGPRHYGHPGNYYFREVLAPHFRDLYEVVSRDQKAAVADAMVDTIRAMDGQFVEYDETHGWVQVTDAVAREKASMTLRTKPRTAEERRAKRERYK